MNSFRIATINIAMLVFVIVSAGTVLGEDVWYPFQFETFERFEYRVTWKESSDTYEAFYILDIQEGENGDALVSYTTTMSLDRSELGQDMPFYIMEKYVPTLWHGFVGVAPEFLFEGLKLEEGEQFLYPDKYGEIMEKIEQIEQYGFEEEAEEARKEGDIDNWPVINIIGKEDVGERTGFIGKIREKKADEEVLIELVIDPELPLPIRTKLFDKTDVEVVLVEYEKY